MSKGYLTKEQEGVVQIFADGVKVLGLPRSVGEIYGLLYGSVEALSLDDFVIRLGVSKGTASQGLKMLRTLGAVIESADPDGRKTYYEADVELKSLVGGFIREEVRPHLDSAKGKIQDLREGLDDGDEFMVSRVERLETWRKKASFVLPLLQKFLGN